MRITKPEPRTSAAAVATRCLCAAWWLLGCGSPEANATGGGDAGVLDASGEEAAPEAQAEAGEDAVTAQCGLTYDEPVCGACMDERCCDQTLEYAMVPESAAYDACVRACAIDDNDCFDQCVVSHPAGFVRYRPWAGCMRRQCTAECSIEAEAACGLALVDEGCNTCAQQRCCDLGYDVVSSTDISELIVCQMACPASDSDCLAGCIALYPEGYVINNRFTTCLQIECTDACAADMHGEYPCGDFNVGGNCETCTYDQCCEDVKNLSHSDDYSRYVACYYGCGTDDACKNACMLKHLEGYGLSTVVSGCVKTQCPTECAQYGSAPCGGIFSPISTTCNACMVDACCEQWSELGASIEGTRYLTCQSACNSGGYVYAVNSCLAECMMTYPDGYVLNRLSDTCQWNHCVDDCHTQNPPQCGIQFDEGSACGACVEANCCGEAYACASDFDCARIDLCRYLDSCAPTDTTCLDACKSANPAGAPAFDAWMACEAASCAAECP